MEKTFELLAQSESLIPFRTDLRVLLGKTGLDEKKVGEALLAVQEVLTNIVRHAYSGETGKVEVTVRDVNDQIHIIIRDFGKKFDLTQVPDPKLPREEPGGLGIYLVKTLMDEVRYDAQCQEGNRIHLIKSKSSSDHLEERSSGKKEEGLQ